MFKQKITWLCDVDGWAYNNRAKLLSESMSNYDHEIMFGVNNINEKAKNSDIIVVMYLHALKHISKVFDNKIIVTLSGNRIFDSVGHVVLYYTDNTLDGTVLGKTVWDNLIKVSSSIPIIAVSQKPIDARNNVCVGLKPRNSGSILEQILAGLDVIDPDTYVFLAEHDVLYHQSHFKIMASDVVPQQFNCNTNNFRCTKNGYSIGTSDKILSQFSGFAGDLKKIFINKLELFKKGGNRLMECLEPGRGKPTDFGKLNTYVSVVPNVDIRHNGCISIQSLMMPITKELEFWGHYKNLRNKLCLVD